MVDRFYTAEELAELWQVSVETVYREAQRGRLVSTRVGNRRRFAESDVQRYQKENREGPEPDAALIPFPTKRRTR